jgi:hypothetical protein
MCFVSPAPFFLSVKGHCCLQRIRQGGSRPRNSTGCEADSVESEEIGKAPGAYDTIRDGHQGRLR